ncbi:NAD(P)-dependent alcohol dehydrogenase [Myxococcus llanfairpwllgwyngyllgogerychwyrndrobwllllantysiliogogogochensis]|uniref:NAD(P)-dependent alcohol dehydrogenase n=1 Tax=Myxococcus llanfairpwllgwyngyllgogerychwyrndrobwllllantysiliogogogochensis TaxID=2590453 RepID=A0A540WMZ2_9BACT|nr:NAD(P)-dependent alcohol dehydrogenase [Myxococcus llanfairpwllgwyngyllgogerychwyrndrobwllllantysiliogogogochensis]TQF10392.1 NAD(P)-dependent alcohol dehydrogenase [Myxococcus llanfairpwllgwyngyllgogerychwyrndrobwllllantysiliogogogochensis]
MRAITFYEYGSPQVLKCEERPVPTPGAGQVLVRVRACALNAADWHILRADPFLARLAVGLFKPRYNVLGCDLAGVVEAAGPGVTRFKAGDEVMGELGSSNWGAFAEYVCAPEGVLASKPASLGFEEAAAAPLAGVTALQGLRREGRLQAGESVLVNGASGGVGTFAVQLAKALGAKVTAVCSARNQELARSLGADEVIDYSKEDFTRSGQRYDVILAANGYHPLSAYERALAPGGRYVMTGGAGKQMAAALLLGPVRSLGSRKRLGYLTMKSNLDDLEYLRDRLADGSVRSVIDRTYPFEELPQALAYLEEGHARGKVAIHMS